MAKWIILNNGNLLNLDCIESVRYEFKKVLYENTHNFIYAENFESEQMAKNRMFFIRQLLTEREKK